MPQGKSDYFMSSQYWTVLWKSTFFLTNSSPTTDPMTHSQKKKKKHKLKLSTPTAPNSGDQGFRSWVRKARGQPALEYPPFCPGPGGQSPRRTAVPSVGSPASRLPEVPIRTPSGGGGTGTFMSQLWAPLKVSCVEVRSQTPEIGT